MSETAPETRTVVIEREFPHPPEKLWRALTQPHLIGEWLMRTDFEPVLGHKFQLRADWGAVDCEVKAIEPNRTLTYTWAAYGLQSLVTFTLTPAGPGTHLRMEQAGFPVGNEQAYRGAQFGWKAFLGKLEQLLAGID